MSEPVDRASVVYRSVLTERDVTNFQSLVGKRSFKHHGVALRAVALFAALAPLAAVTVLSEQSKQFHSYDTLIVGWGITVVIMLVSFTVLNNAIVSSARHRISRDATVFRGLHTFRVSDEGLAVETPVGEDNIPWLSISDIERNKDIVVFFVDSVLAYCARCDALPEPATAGAILDVSTKYMQTSQQRRSQRAHDAAGAPTNS